MKHDKAIIRRLIKATEDSNLSEEDRIIKVAELYSEQIFGDVSKLFEDRYSGTKSVYNTNIF